MQRSLQLAAQTEAMYALELQKHRLMIERLRDKSPCLFCAPEIPGPDFTVRPARAA